LFLCAACLAQSLFPSGLTRYAGKDASNQIGDNGPAYYASLHAPAWLTLDANGNIYVSEFGRIRKIDTRGIITTVLTVDSTTPGAMAIDAQGNLIFALGLDIQRVTPAGVRTTLVKNAFAGSLALDAQGQLYFVDPVGGAVRVLRSDDTVATVASGAALPRFPDDLTIDAGGNLIVAGFNGVWKVDRRGAGTQLSTTAGSAVAEDASGNLFLTSYNFQIPTLRKVTTSGSDEAAFPNLCGNTAYAHSLRIDAAGNFYFLNGDLVERISPTGKLTTIAGWGPNRFTGDGGPAAAASFAGPSGVTLDSAGRLYIADTANNRIRRVDTDGTVRTIAGEGSPTYDQESACLPDRDDFLRQPQAVALDATGSLYIADTGKDRIRKVTPDGSQSTVGSGLKQPTGVAVDADGNVFIADTGNQRVLKISQSGTTIISVAAKGALALNQSGDLLIPAGTAVLRLRRDGSLTPAAAGDSNDFQAAAVAVDAAGSLYVADRNHAIVQRTSANCNVTSFKDPQLAAPGGLAFDSQGNLYIADPMSGAIWKTAITTPPGNELPTPHLYPFRPMRSAAPTIPPPPPFEPDHFGTNPYYPQEPVAPGELVRITGACIGPFDPVNASVDSAGRLPFTLAGVAVQINNILAPLLSVSEGEVVAVAPNGMRATDAAASSVVLSHRGVLAYGLAPVTGTAPALLTSNSSPSGPALAVNLDGGSQNSDDTPAKRGSVVVLYGTGFGVTTPASVDGQIAMIDPLQTVMAPESVTIGGEPAEVLFAGNAVGFAGLTQLNVRVPASLTVQGALPVVVKGGSGAPNQGRITVWVN
jgi:uncharacterized protein (TIGR03437 family)